MRSCVDTGRQHPIVDVAIALPSNAFSRVTIAKRDCCDVASFCGLQHGVHKWDSYEYVRVTSRGQTIIYCDLHSATESLTVRQKDKYYFLMTVVQPNFCVAVSEFEFRLPLFRYFYTITTWQRPRPSATLVQLELCGRGHVRFAELEWLILSSFFALRSLTFSCPS